jgi:hypothetical protein
MRVSRVAVGLVVLVAACSAEGTKTVQTLPDCTLQTITVSPPYATLHPGDTVRANASHSVCPQDNGPALTYRWRSSDTSVAVVDSVAGLVRARKTGTASLVATAAAAPSVQGAMALNVVP